MSKLYPALSSSVSLDVSFNVSQTVSNPFAEALGAVDEIYAIGDSYTEVIGSPDYSYPVTLASLSGKPTTNGGVGGESASEIANRFAALPLEDRQKYSIMWEQPPMGTQTTGDNDPDFITAGYRTFADAGRRTDGVKIFVVPANRCLNSYSAGTKAIYVTNYAAIKSAMVAEFTGDEADYLLDMNDWMVNPRRYSPADATDVTDQTDGLIPASFRRVGNLSHLNDAGSEFSGLIIHNHLLTLTDAKYDALVAKIQYLWRMDEYNVSASVGPDRLDSVGTSDAVGANTINKVDGKFGHASSFVSSGRARVPHETGFNFSGDFTISCWVKPATGTGASGRIIDRWATGGGMILRLGSGNFEWMGGPALTKISSPSAYTLDQWHHIEAYYNSTTNMLGLIVDGVAQTEVSLASMAWQTEDLTFGASAANSAPFTGAVQQIIFFDELLTADDRAIIRNPRSGSITAFADGGGGQVTVTSASHGLMVGDMATISGTTSYNGDFTVAAVTANTFEITDTWVADDATGTWAADGQRIPGL